MGGQGGDGQPDTEQKIASEEPTAGEETAAAGQPPTNDTRPDLILRYGVVGLGAGVVVYALLFLSRTNSFVAIFAMMIGALLALLGLFFARVKTLGGSSAPRSRRPRPGSAVDVASRVAENPKFLRLVVTQLLLTHSDIRRIVMDQPPEVQVQIFEALKEKISQSST